MNVLVNTKVPIVPRESALRVLHGMTLLLDKTKHMCYPHAVTGVYATNRQVHATVQKDLSGQLASDWIALPVALDMAIACLYRIWPNIPETTCLNPSHTTVYGMHTKSMDVYATHSTTGMTAV